MTKKEFLNKLEEALLEQMDISEAAPHIRYYQDYIENEVRNGRDEKEVVASLQNPRLLAKNLVNNSKSANKYKSDIYTEKTGTENYNYAREGYREENYSRTDNCKRGNSISFSVNGRPINSIWLKIALVIIAILAVVIVLAVVSGVIWLLFKVILPVALIGGLIYLLVNVIRKSL